MAGDKLAMLLKPISGKSPNFPEAQGGLEVIRKLDLTALEASDPANPRTFPRLSEVRR